MTFVILVDFNISTKLYASPSSLFIWIPTVFVFNKRFSNVRIYNSMIKDIGIRAESHESGIKFQQNAKSFNQHFVKMGTLNIITQELKIF